MHAFPFALSGLRRSLSSRTIGTALISSALLLGGCASIAPDTGSSTASESVKRTYHERIDLAGRLSVQYQQNGKDEFLHGSFTWKQDDKRSDIALLSPLGQIIATIAITPSGASLTESGKAPRTADDVDALVAQTLGWPLPIAGLRQWLQGFATDKDSQAFVAGNNGDRITTRDGWQLAYANWQTDAAGNRYAKRLDLSHQTNQAGKVEIRIVIDNWQPR
ncbi:lipoprotein insertase outer membrane protein LolB [Oxalicibacterium faecigallinarum]|uniref:Outer-membrane lipoprotein LolB n=1 Tax=Oxalicibacterium faecigallinarum TaxID=573741 RepID=A0A8J3AZF5_9BURK|nr:lipoprotein insertase outer membrane protein LolB [Oxalicibacterium faecigallinarum]GGI19988.1 hypothetical protein GCM10008066_21780 [Oxalicibacterium faecigallinarum]